MSTSIKTGANFVVRIKRKWLSRIINTHCTFMGIFSASRFERYMTKNAPAFLKLIKVSAYHDNGSYTALLELTRKL